MRVPVPGKSRMGGFVAAFVVGLGLACAAPAGAPQVETYDDGSAAVTLDGGLAVVLDRTVTRAVRDRQRRLDRVIDRHARGNDLRARAICAYARSLGQRPGACASVRPPHGTRMQQAPAAAGNTRQARPAPERTRPLGTGLDGIAESGTTPRTRRNATPPRGNRNGRETRRPTTVPRTDAARAHRPDPTIADGADRPTSPPRPARASRESPSLRRTAPLDQRARTPGVQGTPRSETAPRETQPRRRRVQGTGRLRRPPETLRSSSLSTSVTDPVASPSSVGRWRY
jgi:hypothetical protein